MSEYIVGGLIAAAVIGYFFYYYLQEEKLPEPKAHPGIPSTLLVERVQERILWCELPEVITSGILEEILPEQKLLQESIFEILTSEVSFNNSLRVLKTLLLESNQFTSLLSQDELRIVAGNIDQIQQCSESFLDQLMSKWEDNLYVKDVGGLINYYALNKFTVYREYCGNQPLQARTLHGIMAAKPEFLSIIKNFEDNPKCHGLTLDSFLMMPMQRITRLPLLLSAIIKRMKYSEEQEACREALENLTKLVHECNEAARYSQDSMEAEGMLAKLELLDVIKESSLGKFIMKEDFVKYPTDPNATSYGRSAGSQINWNFRKVKPKACVLILFSYRLLVIKKKSSGKLELLDSASTASNNVTFKAIQVKLNEVSREFPHSVVLYFCREKTYHILGAQSQSVVERWQRELESIKHIEDLSPTSDIIMQTTKSRKFMKHHSS